MPLTKDLEIEEIINDLFEETNRLTEISSDFQIEAIKQKNLHSYISTFCDLDKFEKYCVYNNIYSEDFILKRSNKQKENQSSKIKLTKNLVISNFLFNRVLALKTTNK